MPRIQEELDLIAKLLKELKRPLSISEIQEQLKSDIKERTLLRRLDKLINEGLVIKTGEKSGTAYQFSINKKEVDQHAEQNLIPLTKQGKDLLVSVNQPQISRRPVGYNRSFLENYKPNIDSYLTKEEKDKLAEVGRTARENEPAGTYAKDILQRLLIDLSWNSSRLEGNTYSLLDTERLISAGEVADNKSAKDTQMILNHKEAIEFIVDNSEEIGFNRYTIMNIHALLSNNLLPDPGASGRLRTLGVGIQQSVYTPLGIPQLIVEMFDMMLEKASQIEDPFEQGFFIMVHLPYLQPFEDVNKRVSRLAANISLNKKNLVPISFIDVPNSLYLKGLLAVYELNKVELLKDVFLWSYERSSARYSALRQSLGEPDLFRMKYRENMRSLVYEIVSTGLSYKEASDLIEERVADIPEEDQEQFRESVDEELLSLHEGNIARYRLRPSEFRHWKERWKSASIDS